MRLINRRMQTRKMNRRCDVFNAGFVSVLMYLFFFLVLGNVIIYVMGVIL